MAEVTQVRPKGVYVSIDFPLEELEKLKAVYDHCQLNLDLSNPEEKELERYFINEHYPFLERLVKELKYGPGRNS
jgi:hypothetical protein